MVDIQKWGESLEIFSLDTIFLFSPSRLHRIIPFRLLGKLCNGTDSNLGSRLQHFQVAAQLCLKEQCHNTVCLDNSIPYCLLIQKHNEFETFANSQFSLSNELLILNLISVPDSAESSCGKRSPRQH